MTIRVINACNNWGFKRGLISKPIKIEGGSKWENRSRVLSDSELKTLLLKSELIQFNLICQIFYTGLEAVKYAQYQRKTYSQSLVSYGKTIWKRLIILNNQAQEIIVILMNSGISRTSYRTSSRKKPEGLIKYDIRFHDLSRKIGYSDS